MVDDEEFCITCMKSILMGSGVDIANNVDFCINGKEAYEHVMASYRLGFSFAMIFTDFSMPILNGIESTKQMRHFF